MRTLLHDMLVVDLTQFEAGTSCTQMLAWLGARVIKVEPPPWGDPGRWIGGSTDKSSDSPYFMLHNNNKQSITLNLKCAQGLALFRELVKRADVVAENLAPGTFERLGFSYEVLKELNPRIIYVTIKGFGTSGPYRDFKSFDMTAQALGGAFAATGFAEDPPTYPGPVTGDTGAGLHAAIGVLAAYLDRKRTGRAYKVEVSMQEAVVNFMRNSFVPVLESGQSPPRQGNRNPASVPGNAFACHPGGPDDYVYIDVPLADTAAWEALARLIGHPELAARYRDPAARLAHREEIEAQVAAWVRPQTRQQAMQACAQAGVPCGATLNTLELLHDPHLRARGALVTVQHPEFGPITLPGSPMRVSPGGDLTYRPAPLLGQHNAEVYAEFFGFDAAKLEALRKEGVI
ncbi:MAG: formyl-CoA:oxalate CoA-transferase [Candidatus Tectimicrobiota bacterium]|nr:MAG: formyl-CoA:oxalate CoA-transferase [Candidatus Tectomicrobia bacterium]